MSAVVRSIHSTWLLLALALVLLGAQTGYDLINARRLIEDEAKDRLTNHSLVLADELERRLRSIHSVLGELSTSAPVTLTQKSGAESLTRQLHILANSIEGLRTLTVIDASGNIVAANRPEVVGMNFSHRSYFQTFRDQPQPDRLHLSQPFKTVLGVYTVVLSRPIYGPKGKFGGIVTATMDTDNLHKLLLTLHASPDTRLVVVHGSGLILNLTPDKLDIKPGTTVDKPGSFFRRHMASGQQQSMMQGISATIGTESLMAMRTVQPPALSLDTPLIVGVARDRTDILAAWQSMLLWRVGIFLLVIVLSVLALALYQQRQRSFDRKMQAKEDERLRSQLVLQRFIDHLPGTAYVKDANAVTLMANRGFQTLLGMDPAAMIGKTTGELFPGEFSEKILADDRRVLDTGFTQVIEESFNGRDYESTKFVIDTGFGEKQLGGMTVDITARKRVERERDAQLLQLRELNQKLEAAQNQLLQSEKMASIGQLAAGVAHELNNPIGFVHSNLATLDRYLKDIFEIAAVCEEASRKTGSPAEFAAIEAVKQQKDFAYIRTDVFQLVRESREGLERVTKIVRDLKDFSRAGEAEWQWADLHAGLDSTLNVVWNELKYKCTVTKEYSSLPRIWCEPSQLNQVFMNLLINAGHAIADKGNITIRTGQQGEEVFVAIADTGCGIPPENINRLFEPFFTTKPVGKGTGLGLSLAYSIVKKHKGRIKVASETGQGATFTVWLPIEPAEPPATDGTSAFT